MKLIGILLLLLINISNITTTAAKTDFIGQSFHDRRLQVDRYTGYKTDATLEEVNPLLVLTQINFPSAIKTVQQAIDHALQRSGYRMDWQQSSEAYDIFSGLDMPLVHRKLNLMTLKDAIATLAGEAWQLLIDSVNRKLLIQQYSDVSWQTTKHPNGSNTFKVYPEKSISSVEQMGANRYLANDFMPAQAEQNRLQHGYLNLPEKQSLLDKNIIDDNIRASAVIDDEPVADPAYLEKTKTPTLYDVDLHDETQDRPRNQNTRGNIKPHHEATISYVDDAKSSDRITNIRRVQYAPEYSNLPHTELNEQTPTKEHDITSDLWSVRPVIKAKEGVGSLDEAVIVHYSSISVKDLIEILIPKGWVVHYEVSDATLKQKLVSHAESSRRDALSSLFKELNLKALFYPGQAVVVVAEKTPKSYNYSHPSKIKSMDSRNIDTSEDSLPDIPDAHKSQPEIDTILRTARTIKDLMYEMEPNSK